MKKLFLTSEKDTYNEIIELLGYQKVKENNSLFKGYTSLTYSKRNSNPLSESFINEHMPKSMVPFFFVILFVILAVLLATTFLVLVLINPDINFRFIMFFSLMVPSFLSLLTATGVTFLRYFVTLRNMRCLASKALIIKEYEK